MIRFVTLSFIVLALSSGVASAQETIPTQPPIPSLLPAANDPAAPSPTPPVPVELPLSPTAVVIGGDASPVSPTPVLVSTGDVVKKESLFFTPNQLMSIMRANQGFIAPTEGFDAKNQTAAPTDSGPRVIALTGILYNGPKDWTIWLNGERVTPKNIPDRIMGLTVKADRVHIRWMDIGNQRIVNITLRANQKYLLDSDEIVTGSQ